MSLQNILCSKKVVALSATHLHLTPEESNRHFILADSPTIAYLLPSEAGGS